MLRKGPERDFFVRGVAAGMIAMSAITMAANFILFPQVESVQIEAVQEKEQAAPSPAGEAMQVLAQALYLTENVMNRELSKGDIPAIVTGALHALDPYSGYVEKEQADQIMVGNDAQTENFMVGILGTSEGPAYEVIGLVPESPAARAGVLPGDKLVSIDGFSVEEVDGKKAFEELRNRIDAGHGALMTLGFARGGEVVELSVQPEHLPDTSVFDLGVIDGMLHLRIGGFFHGVTGDAMKIVKARQERGEIRGVIVDLRGNRGGLVTEAEGLANLFFPAGKTLFSSEGRHMAHEEVVTQEDPVFHGLVLAVLIDGGSASASEIFASAVQANEMGPVVGTKSFGKGTIQNVYPFTDGSGALKITVGEYKDALGRAINGIGVVPDILVERPVDQEPGKDPVLDAALEALAGKEGEDG